MKSDGRHAVAELLGSAESPERVENFVWVYLSQKGVIPGLSDFTVFPQQSVALHLKTFPDLLATFRRLLSFAWIPDQELGWLTDSPRQAFWVERSLEQRLKGFLSQAGLHDDSLLARNRIPQHLGGARRSIGLFDYWSSCLEMDMGNKIFHLKSMNTAWSLQMQADRDFDWLDAEDAKLRRPWFWERLQSRFPVATRGPVPDDHDSLLNLLGSIGLHPAELELFNTKAKRDYGQRLRRSSDTNRKQCNFVLEGETISKLKSLASKYALSRTEVIEILIQSESNRPVHISERLQRVKRLLDPHS